MAVSLRQLVTCEFDASFLRERGNAFLDLGQLPNQLRRNFEKVFYVSTTHRSMSW